MEFYVCILYLLIGNQFLLSGLGRIEDCSRELNGSRKHRGRWRVLWEHLGLRVLDSQVIIGHVSQGQQETDATLEFGNTEKVFSIKRFFTKLELYRGTPRDRAQIPGK